MQDRIWAISDIHVDFSDNMKWIEALASPEYAAGTLILAGDVSHDLGVIEQAFAALRRSFARVFYTVGNHELWIDRESGGDSLEKCAQVEALCRRLGIETEPARVGQVWVVPLWSWYDGSFGGGAPPPDDLARWADFKQCRWPFPDGDVARHFLARNTPALRPYDAPVVSFSHFLPRADLLPPRSVLRFKALPEVAGTTALDGQLRAIGSRVHVFGHTHINLDVTREGVRYVQNALRYPRERAHFDQPPVPPKLVWP